MSMSIPNAARTSTSVSGAARIVLSRLSGCMVVISLIDSAPIAVRAKLQPGLAIIRPDPAGMPEWTGL